MSLTFEHNIEDQLEVVTPLVTVNDLSNPFMPLILFYLI